MPLGYQNMIYPVGDERYYALAVGSDMKCVGMHGIMTDKKYGRLIVLLHNVVLSVWWSGEGLIGGGDASARAFHLWRVEGRGVSLTYI